MSIESQRVLVVSRAAIFRDESFYGIDDTRIEELTEVIRNNAEYKERGLVEDDPGLKQIVAYMVFRREGRYFLMQRNEVSGDERLRSRYSLGIGGHMNEDDLKETDLEGWCKRKFKDEVDHDGNANFRIIGFLNDDTNKVGEVHLGMVVLVEGDTSDIQLRSTDHKFGKLVTVEELRNVYEKMESWSQIVFDYLCK